MTRGTWQGDVPLVLASGSTTRRRLMEAAGLIFETIVPNVDEAAIKAQAQRDGLGPDRLASILAEAKARAGAQRRPGAMVIGADQVLCVEGEWFDKPTSIHQARAQLGRLRGKRQVLHTAVAVVRDDVALWRDLASPVVVTRFASDAILDLYVAREGDALLSSAGALRIEGQGQMLVDSIDGEQSAILGLPMLSLLGGLRQAGALLV